MVHWCDYLELLTAVELVLLVLTDVRDQREAWGGRVMGGGGDLRKCRRIRQVKVSHKLLGTSGIDVVGLCMLQDKILEFQAHLLNPNFYFDGMCFCIFAELPTNRPPPTSSSSSGAGSQPSSSSTHDQHGEHDHIKVLSLCQKSVFFK